MAVLALGAGIKVSAQPSLTLSKVTDTQLSSAAQPYRFIGSITVLKPTGGVDFVAGGSVVNDARTVLTTAQVVYDASGVFRDLSKVYWNNKWNSTVPPEGGVPIRCAWVFTGGSGYAAGLTNSGKRASQYRQQDVAVLISYGRAMAEQVPGQADSLGYQVYPNSDADGVANPATTKRLIGYPRHAGDYFMYESSATDDVFANPDYVSPSQPGTPSLWQLVTQDTWTAGSSSLVSALGMEGAPLLVTRGGEQVVAGVLVSNSDAAPSSFSNYPQPGGPGRPGVRLITSDVINSLLNPAGDAASASIVLSGVSGPSASFSNIPASDRTEVVWPTTGQRYSASFAVSPANTFRTTDYRAVGWPSWVSAQVSNGQITLTGQPPLSGEMDVYVFAWDHDLITSLDPGWSPTTANYGPVASGYALIKRIHLTFGKGASEWLPQGTVTYTRKDLWNFYSTNNDLYTRYSCPRPSVSGDIGHAFGVTAASQIPFSWSDNSNFSFGPADVPVTKYTTLIWRPGTQTISTDSKRNPGTVTDPPATTTITYAARKFTGFYPVSTFPFVEPFESSLGSVSKTIANDTKQSGFLELAYIGSDLVGLEIVGPDRIRLPTQAEVNSWNGSAATNPRLIKYQVRLYYADGTSRLVTPSNLQDGSLLWSSDDPSHVTAPPSGKILASRANFGDLTHNRVAENGVPPMLTLAVTYSDGAGPRVTAFKTIEWTGSATWGAMGSVGALSPAFASLGAAAGDVDVSFTATTTWTADVAGADGQWLSVPAGTSGGAGSWTIRVHAAVNSAANLRSGHVYIGDQVFRVDQSGTYNRPTVTPASFQIGAASGSRQVTVNTSNASAWSAFSLCDWIQLVVVSNGQTIRIRDWDQNAGSGSLTFENEALPSGLGSRIGQIVVAGQVITITQTQAAGSPPTLAAPAPIQSIVEDGSRTFDFTVGPSGSAGSLVFSATTLTNATLVPNDAVHLATSTLSATSRRVTVTPASNGNGSAVVEVRVTDPASGLYTTYNLPVTVTPVNDAPVVSVVSGVRSYSVAGGTAGSPPGTLTVPMQVGDIDTPIASLLVNASSNQTTIIPSANVVVGSRSANGNFNVTVTPALNQSSATAVRITVTASDGAAAPVSDFFDVTVTSTPPTITSSAIATGAVGSPLTYQITASASPTSFGATGLPSGLAVNPTTGVITGTPLQAGQFSSIISATNSFGTGTATLSIEIDPPTLEAALDTEGIVPHLDWVTYGDLEGDFLEDPSAVWSWQSQTTHDGLDAAKSPLLNDWGYSVVYTQVTGPGTLTFWWKVSSEDGFDHLEVFVDGESTPRYSISGEVGWEQKTVLIPEGQHYVSWIYWKDSSFSEGADAGWVDQVVFTPPDPRTPTITSPAASVSQLGQAAPYYQITATSTAPLSPIVYGASWAYYDPANGTTQSKPLSDAGLAVNPSTGAITGSTVVADSYRLDVTAANDYGIATKRVVVSISSVSLPVALDAPSYSWNPGGDAPWFGQTGRTHDGVDAAASGRISASGDWQAPSQATWMETTVNGPGDLTFWWKVSSEAGYDFLRFMLNGSEVAAAPAITGEQDWQMITVQIPAGNSQVLRWQYDEDYIFSVGEDRGWVDQVTYTPADSRIPQITSPAGATGYLGQSGPYYQVTAISTPSSTITYGIDPGSQLPSGLTLNPGTGAITGTPSSIGTFQFTVTAANSHGTVSKPVSLKIGALSLPVALDTDSGVSIGAWRTGGDGAIPYWFGQTETTQDGVDAAQSGPIGNSQASWLETSVTGPGTLTFWWKVSSEEGWDYLRFLMDGSEQLSVPGIAGEVGWEQRTVQIAGGADVTHTLRWQYAKDSSVSLGDDAGRVDRVVFTPTVDTSRTILISPVLPISEDQYPVGGANPLPVSFTITPDSSSLTITARSNNQALVPDENIAVAGAVGNRRIEIRTAADRSGVATITISATLGAAVTTASFNLTVTPVNDAPTIGDIADLHVQKGDAPLSIVFNVADVDSAVNSLVTSASIISSSPAGVVTIGSAVGTGFDRSLSVTPGTTATGNATIRVTVSDGALSRSDDFVVYVDPVDAPPIFIPVVPGQPAVANQVINENTATPLLEFMVDDAETKPESLLTVTAVSSNQTIVPNANISLGHNGGRRTIRVTPAFNQATGYPVFGAQPVVITLRVSDGSISHPPTSMSFSLFVLPGNAPPSISQIPATSTDEDTPVIVFFTMSDDHLSPTSLTVATTSSNTTLLPQSRIAFGGGAIPGNPNLFYLTLTPALNQNGFTDVTVRVTDYDNYLQEPERSNAARSVQTVFRLTVNPVNDTPIIKDKTYSSNVTSPEDTPWTGQFTVEDVESAPERLVVVGTSTNQTVVPNANIVVTGTGARRTVTITPAPDASDVTIITLTVSDGAATSSDTFQLTFVAVPEVPRVNPVAGVPGSNPIANQTTNEDTPFTVPFTVFDPDNPTDFRRFTITCIGSDNPTLIPTGNVVINNNPDNRPNGDYTTNRTLTVTPALNQTGSSLVTVRVDAGGGRFKDSSFTVTVNPVNDPPLFSGTIGDRTINEDSVLGPLAVTIGDVDSVVSALTLTASSSNQVLVPNSNITLGGSGASRTVTITPRPNQFGTVTDVSDTVITLTATDDYAGTSGPAPGQTSMSFRLKVNPLNDPPTISEIQPVFITEDAGEQTLAFTVDDFETPPGSLVVTATTSDGTLIPPAAIFVGGTGGNRTLRFTPGANQFGTASITIKVSDGSIADDGTKSFNVTVAAVNDAPTISTISSATTNEGSATSALSFTVADQETSAASLLLSATSDNAALVPPGNVVFGGSGANRTVTVTPAASQNGTATITVKVTDQGAAGTGPLSATTSFLVTVNAVNDPPVISAIPAQTIVESSSTAAIPFTVSDVESAPTSLTVTGLSSNTTLVPNNPANITFGPGSGTNRSVVITPASGEFGSATISLTVTDPGGQSSTTSFTLTVANNEWFTDSSVTLGTNGSVRAIAYQADGKAVIGGTFTTVGGTPRNRIARINADGTLDATFNPGGVGADWYVTALALDGSQRILIGGEFTGVGESAASAGTLRRYLARLDTNGNIDTTFNPSSNSYVRAIIVQPDGQILVGGEFTSIGGQSRTYLARLNGSNGAAEAGFIPNPNNHVHALLLQSDGRIVVGGTFTTLAGGTRNCVGRLVSGGTIDSSFANPNAAGSGADVRCLGIQSSGSIILGGTFTTLGGASHPYIGRVDSTGNVDGTFSAAVTGSGASVECMRVQPDDRIILGGFFTGLNGQTRNYLGMLRSTGALEGRFNPQGGVPFRSGADSTVFALALQPDLRIWVGGAFSFLGGQARNFIGRLDHGSGPTITDIPDQTFAEGGTTGPLSFTVGDSQTAAASLSVTASSGNTSLVPNGNIVLAGTTASRTVTVTPAANQYGTAVITVKVSDGTLMSDGTPLSASDSFLVTVTPVNSTPTISHVFASPSINEDTGTGALAFTVGDAPFETPAGLLSVSASSGNTSLVPNANIVLGGSGANRTINVLPSSNQTGTALITLTVSDGTASAVDSFLLTVNPVNDAPVISHTANVSVNEEGSTGPLSFTIGDVETPLSLTVTGASSNTTLVPNANIVVSPSGTSRTVTVTPAGNQFGTAVITLTVSDGVASASDAFVLTVNPLNDAPVISHGFANPTINEDATTGGLPFTVGDVETAAGSLVVTAASTNITLVPLSGISFGGSGAARTVQLTPAANQVGSATITLTVSDGTLTATDSFVVTVNAVNDLPTINPHIAGRTINEDSNTGAIAFTIADVETAVGSLQLTGTSSNTTLVPNGNIVFGTGSGGNRQVIVSPAANQTGFTDITVTVSDGTASSSDTFRLTVSPVNDPPTISHTVANQAINEDGITVALPFVVDDLETPGALTMTATSSNTGLLPIANIVFTTVGPSQNDRAVTLTPAPNQFGSSTVSIIVSDGTLTASHTFVLNVLPVNDTPTIGPIADTSIYFNSTTTPPIAFAIGDVETPASSLTVSVVSADTNLIPNSNLVLGGGDANRTLAITPAANQSGTTAVTVTVSDIDQNPNSGGPKSVQRIFLVAVQAPEIVIEQPAGTGFPDGGTQSFGIVAEPYQAEREFTIRNTGNAVLSGINATFDGPDGAMFSIVKVDGVPANALPPVVVPGGSRRFTVQFAPAFPAGAKSGAMHIACNDVDENPFDINLTGSFVARVNSADLSNIQASAGALTPSFSPGVLDYSISVPNATSSTTLTAAALVPTATIKVNGSQPVSGQVFETVNLVVGPNPIVVDVTSQDLVTTKRYTVTVYRSNGGNTKAQIVSPPNGSALTSRTLALTLNPGVNVASRWLSVGTVPGGADVLPLTDQGSVSIATVTVSNVPADRRIHATLYSKFIGATSYVANYYVYDPVPAVKAVLTSPSDGSTLPGSSFTATWTAGVGVSSYVLWLGSSPGGYDLGIGARTFAGPLSYSFNGVVTDGGPVYLTLYSLINGAYSSNLYSFNTPQGGGNRGAILTSHTNGSTLTSAVMDLAWDAGVGVSSYYLWVGSVPNGSDLAAVSMGTGRSQSVAIPGDGRRVYVTLHSLIGAAYQSNAYWFTAPSLPDAGAAQVTSPAIGSTLSDANLTLNWSVAAGSTQYYLFVGGSPGGFDLYAGSQGLNTSATLTGKMPLDGRPVYVTLYSLINNAWRTSSAWYTTANAVLGNKRALLSSPVNGTALTSSSVTFAWGGGVGVTAPGYALWIGSSPGAYDLLAGAYPAGTNSAAVTLPIDGRKIYVTLYSWVNNMWQGASYLYTTSDSVKSVVTSPVPGGILPYPPPTKTNSTATFGWSKSEAATAYYLWIGRAPGGSDVYAKSEANGLSDTVTTLPADGGPVYVTIYSYIKGAWQTSEAIYQSATP